MNAVGQSIPYLDARARVDGSLPYILNLNLPGMLHAKVLRSIHPHARLVRIDTTAAASAPGVVTVLTGQELADDRRINHIYGIGLGDQPILAVDRVRYVGEAIVGLVAETVEQAEFALDLIEVEYESLPFIDNEVEAVAPGAPILHAGSSTNVVSHSKLRHGDVESAFAASDYVIEEIFSSPTAQQVTLEPHVSLAQFTDGRLTVHTSSQSPFGVRRVLTEIFNLKPDQVRVIVGPLGGGYGAKGHIRLEPIIAALAWKIGGRPVKLVATRAEEFVIVTKHAATMRIKSGIMRDGSITARDVTSWWNTGAYADAGFMLTKGGLLRSIGPYRIPVVRADAYQVYTNRPPAAAFRGAMTAQGEWAFESHMDSLAHAVGMNPLELRRKNLLREGDTWATGEVMHDVHYSDCLDEVLRLLEADGPVKPPTGSLRRGRGLAVMIKNSQSPSRSEARVALYGDGHATVFTSSVEMGQGAHTAMAQIAADQLRLPVQAIMVVGPDTDQTPFDQVTTGSRTTYMMGNAVKRAARALADQIRALGGKRYNLQLEEIRLEDGRMYAPDGDSQSYSDLLNWAGLPHLIAQSEFKTESSLDEDSQGVACSHWHQGAGACEVEVDIETGKLSITRYAGASWAGKLVNPAHARSQDQGNVIYGLGQTLFEEMVFEGGQVINANMGDYLIPSLRDVPDVLRTTSLESKLPDADMYGIGEMTLPCVAPAVSNALYDAIGIRIRTLPLKPERILLAIREQAI